MVSSRWSFLTHQAGKFTMAAFLPCVFTYIVCFHLYDYMFDISLPHQMIHSVGVITKDDKIIHNAGLAKM